MVDRYNLYFAFLPSRISKRIHDRAVEITLMATRFVLIFLLFFTLLRYDKGSGELTNRPIAVVLITFLAVLTVVAFMPEISRLFPSVRVFAYLSVLRGPSSVLGEGHRTASEFKPDFIEARTKLVETPQPDESIDAESEENILC